MIPVPGCRLSQSMTVSRIRQRLAMPLLLCLAAPAAWAFNSPDALIDTPSSTSVAQLLDMAGNGDDRPRLQMEMSGTSLPRFDNTDGSTHSSRIGMTLLPPRRSALGLSVGITNMNGSMLPAGASFAGSSPSMDLGVHWRYALDGNYRVDITAWRRMRQPDALMLAPNDAPAYGARIEMGMGKSSKTGFAADRGFLGFQLESGARITLRRSGGKPMVYYRTKF